MERLRNRIASGACGAVCGLAGIAAVSRCGIGSCASCFGCVGAGLGVVLVALFHKIRGNEGSDVRLEKNAGKIGELHVIEEGTM